jgi:hypothetical protein
MGILSEITSGGVSGLLSSIGTFAKDVRQAITGEISAEKKAELEQKAMEIEFGMMKAQTDINLVEAQHPNLFVAGWRPFIGWTCGVSLWWQFMGNSIFEWIVKLLGKDIKPPELNTEGLITILLALLGLGSMRMMEKIRGVQNSH